MLQRYGKIKTMQNKNRFFNFYCRTIVTPFTSFRILFPWKKAKKNEQSHLNWKKEVDK
jgi:hypothetical protein